jgi:hypothetical protein
MAKTPTEIASLARSFTEPALKTLAAIMRQPKAPAAARVQAAVALLDRGWGKPKQTVGGDSENPPAMTISEIRHTIVDHRPKTENG